MEYKCSLCQQRVAGDLLVYVDHTQTHILEEIKKSHPGWAQADGICQKCLEYYQGELKGNFFSENQCRARRTAIRNFLSKILSPFQSSKK